MLAEPGSIADMLAEGKSWEEIALTLGCQDGMEADEAK